MFVVLIAYLCNELSSGVKKQRDFMGHFSRGENASFEAVDMV